MAEPLATVADLNRELALKVAALVQAAETDPPLSAAGHTKFAPDTLTRIVTALRLGHTVPDACTYAGISPGTYRDWLAKGREGTHPFALFVEVVERLNVQVYTPAVERFAKDAAEDWKAAERFLARRAPKSWGVAGEGGGVTVTVVQGLELKGAPE